MPNIAAKTINYMLGCAIGFLYISNLFVPILEIDAAQYAEMSREMLQSTNWLHLFDLGRDYLDKPPFIFWASALSMKIFGVSVWAYKLPSLLFAVWAIFALYRFSLLFYEKEIATKAAFIFASCQAMFLMVNDIKTDTILMSFAITVFWQIAAWLYKKNNWGWLWAAVSIAGAMLTKGPIGLLVVGFGFLPHFIIKKQWKNILRWQYLPMLIVIAILLLPMSYGLYTQFDMHPEKLVNGEQGVSGLRFYYWTQSFGRITGESVWNNNAGFTFLFQNLLWGLLPFTLFFVMAGVRGLIKLANRCHQTEWISTAAVILAYVSLGISKFQLPHYIYIVLPFICLLTARYFVNIKNFFGHKFRIFRVVHNSLIFLLLTILPIGLFYIFPEMNTWQSAIIVLCMLMSVGLFFLEKGKIISLFAMSIFAVVIINLMLTFVFYPNIIPYQSSFSIPKVVKEKNIAQDNFIIYVLEVGRSADFLLNYNIAQTGILDTALNYQYIATNNAGLKAIRSKGIQYETIFRGASYRIAKLQVDFLNPKTRKSSTTPYYIIKILP